MCRSPNRSEALGIYVEGMATAGGDVVIETMMVWGVEVIFGLPGTSSGSCRTPWFLMGFSRAGSNAVYSAAVAHRTPSRDSRNNKKRMHDRVG
jgi:hypothetical protein